MGNIGTVRRKITLEPMPDTIPVPEIVPQQAPAPEPREPVKVPA